MVIYVDVLLFVNTAVNYAVLTTTEKLLKKECRLYRLLLGALTGALFSLLMFWQPESRLYLWGLKLLSAASVTLITFGWKSKSEFLKTAVCNSAAAAVYSGFFILFYQVFKPPNMVIVNDVVYCEVDPLRLTALTAVIYLLILLLYKLFSERIKNTVVPLKFTVGERSCSCIAKIDTACHLREPFSSSPVIIADDSVFTVDTSLPHRIIPYTAVGSSSYLSAVKADSVLIDKKAVDREVYIASASLRNPHYQAVINSELAR